VLDFEKMNDHSFIFISIFGQPAGSISSMGGDRSALNICTNQHFRFFKTLGEETPTCGRGSFCCSAESLFQQENLFLPNSRRQAEKTFQPDGSSDL